MAISKEQLGEFKQAVDSAVRVLVFFDDDTDGLAAFLQVHFYKQDVIGVAVRAVPELQEQYLKKVEEHQPDLILVFDMPKISEEFLEKNNTSLIWVDHHEPQATKRCTYLNPHFGKAGDNRPTSYWVHQALKSSLWLASVGCVADWFWPDFIGEFKKEFPELLPEDIQTAPDALFNSKVGVLVQIFLFNLKGTVSDMNKSIKLLTKIKSPLEILDQSSEEGLSLFKRYLKYREEYERILNRAPISEEKFIVFVYENEGNAYSSELSNELMYRHPDKAFLVGRRVKDEIRCSLRATKQDVLTPLQQVLRQVEGYGGGHKNACGACIKEKDFAVFVEALKDAFSK